MKRLADRERAEAIVAQMCEMRAGLGFIPAWYMAEACVALGRSRSQMYRWINNGLPPATRSAFALQDGHKVAVFEEHGVGAAWKALRVEGEEVPSRATWYRAAGRDL